MTRTRHFFTKVTFVLLLAAAACLGWAALPSKGLEGHWRFDRVEGDAASDLSGRGRALRITGASFASETGIARSLRCDGFETAAVLEEKTPLAFKRSLTIALWVRPERIRRYEPLVGRPNSNSSWTTPTTGLYLDSGRPVFGIFTSKGRMLLEAPEAMPLQAWSFVVATADGTRLTLWIGGKKMAEMEQKQPIPPPGDIPWFLGCNATQYFRGRVGELAVWDRALDETEINRLFAETTSRYPNGSTSANTASSERERFKDKTVLVASPGSNPAGNFRERPTRMLEGLDGYREQASPSLDRWGGRKDKPALRATGFFRTEKVGDRWWLVTPEGHLYWNVGINAVSKPKAIPSAQAEAWAAQAGKELRDLGFNGLGNWSLDAFRRQDPPFPWCARFDFLSSFAKLHKRTYATSGHTGFAEQCPPVFHPEFASFAREYAARLAQQADDPSIIGIFTDNEIQCPVDLLDRHMKLDQNDAYLSFGRAEAIRWLSERGRPTDPKRFNLKDRLEFVAHFMATYARLVNEAIRHYDKNHLILGPRFNVHASQFENPWFWPAVAPWIDVVAVNYYNLWGPQVEEIQAWCDAMNRPVMLTEWYSKAGDAPGLSNVNGAGWFVRTQEDRALYYQHFLLAAFETRSLVGVHYFKYMDDPKESVALDSAGGANKGMYTSKGEPWEALQRRAKAVNNQAYRLIDFFDTRYRNAGADAK